MQFVLCKLYSQMHVCTQADPVCTLIRYILLSGAYTGIFLEGGASFFHTFAPAPPKKINDFTA